MTLSDKIISAAIKYQIACSRAQGIGAPIEIPQDELDYVAKQAFNELCEAAKLADRCGRCDRMPDEHPVTTCQGEP